MQQTLASLWRPGKSVYIKELETNRYLFQFYHELDIKRVIEGSHWSFNRKTLSISRMQKEGNPRDVPLNFLDIWVQVYDLHTGFMSSRVLKAVGDYIGTFLELCSKNFMGVWREYMRIRVRIDLSKPLTRRMRLMRNKEEWF